jgi:hypothetical protein
MKMLNIKQIIYIIASLHLFLGCQSNETTYKTIFIDSVFTDFPVKFDLYTTSKKQFVAYYDTAHQITLAARNLPDGEWDYKKLDSYVGWDSHNALALLVDSLGYIHLVGNMHSSPLIYFKSTEPNNIHSMQKMPGMLGILEDTTTYPEFLVDNQKRVIFHYRFGRSGNGFEVYNYLDVKNQTWHRLLDVPLLDGEGLRNAYAQGPYLGPDGYYHIIWVWRDTWDCSTNHTLSYTRSKNLTDWESIRGEKVELPITMNQNVLVVDTTPTGGGLINIGIKLGFGSNNEPLIGYHKYDSLGNTQLFIARYLNNEWHSRQLTNWDYRWDFKGMGTIKNELLIEAPFTEDANTLVFGYHHIKYGGGQLVMNESDLAIKSNRSFQSEYPGEIDSVQSLIPDVLVNKTFNQGNTYGEKKYLLRWETLPPNRDGKVEGKRPKPTQLKLVEY